MQANLETFKERLSKYFNEIASVLVVVLLLLFYLTSLLSQTTSLSNTVVDVLIYLIYFALIFTLGSLAFVVYNYYDEASLLTPIRLEKSSAEEAILLSVAEVFEPKTTALDSKMVIEQYKRKVEYLPTVDYKGFRRFTALSSEATTRYLQQQHPQLVATILAYLPTEEIAEVLEKLNAEMRDDIVKVFEESRTVDSSELAVLDAALYKDLFAVQKECDGLKTLSRVEVRKILRQISKIELMFALKGASQELQEMFLVNMSPKASKEFQTVLSTNRDVSPSKSDNAIKNLYLLAQRLREDGKIRAT